jgi:hypothetical protein
MFYFNYKKFDFWLIYDSIKRYYPIGVRKDEGKMYFSYPGLKELENIIVENIHENKNYVERWACFTKEIENEIGKEIIGTTYGQAPSFSAYIIQEQKTFENLTRSKEIHFYVSLVGPFYTVIAQDNNDVIMEGQPFLKHCRTTNYVVVSPEAEFKDAFVFVCAKIETRFKGFRFVPFDICTQAIEGLDVRYADDNLNAVFYALFNNHLDLSRLRVIGDNYYKSADWIKDGYVDDGNYWTAYPPDYIPIEPPK